MENTKLRASQKYKKRSTFDSIWRQLRKNKGAIVGMILLVVIIIIALASPYIFNYETDVIANNVKERMQHPSSEHWFGTDDLGRDIFARVCYGARYSLAVGLVAVAVALVVGVTLGAAAGYVGGVFENLIMPSRSSPRLERARLTSCLPSVSRVPRPLSAWQEPPF